MRGLPTLLCIMWRASFAVASKCNTFSSTSGHGKYLKDHVVQSLPNTSLQDCTNQCIKAGFCRSTNFHSQSKTCELNNADKHDYPDDYIERHGYTYSGWQIKRYMPKSCSEAKQRKRSAKTGYYLIQTKRGKRMTVYCDMDKDGVFRIDVLSGSNSPYTVFYKIPSGASNFDSSCTGQGPPACPRIIISHYYPYQWESNTCNSISVGYRIQKVEHYVFDSVDDSECGGASWRSSGYPGRRVLYGYRVNPGHYGIFSGRQALVFVK